MVVESQSLGVIEMHSKINDSFIHNTIKHEHFFIGEISYTATLVHPRWNKGDVYVCILFNNWGKKYRMHFTANTFGGPLFFLLLLGETKLDYSKSLTYIYSSKCPLPLLPRRRWWRWSQHTTASSPTDTTTTKHKPRYPTNTSDRKPSAFRFVLFKLTKKAKTFKVRQRGRVVLLTGCESFQTIFEGNKKDSN